MIGKTTGPGAFVSRASVRGGWVTDQHDHRRPAHNRRPGRDPQFKTGNKSVIIAARGACFLEDVSYPKLSTLETFLWPMLDPLEIPEVVPVATSPPGTAHGSSGNAMSDAPAESGAGVRVTCDVARGFVEVHDPRLLRHGMETFCLALVKHAVETSGACRAGICLRSSVCRFEFTPGSLDPVELAERAASGIRAGDPGCKRADRLGAKATCCLGIHNRLCGRRKRFALGNPDRGARPRLALALCSSRSTLARGASGPAAQGSARSRGLSS